MFLKGWYWIEISWLVRPDKGDNVITTGASPSAWQYAYYSTYNNGTAITDVYDSELTYNVENNDNHNPVDSSKLNKPWRTYLINNCNQSG